MTARLGFRSGKTSMTVLAPGLAMLVGEGDLGCLDGREQALDSFGPQSREKAAFLTEPAGSLDERIQACLPSLKHDLSLCNAVREVYGDAILWRYLEYIQQVRRLERGLPRQWLNSTGADRLKTLSDCHMDDDRLVQAVAEALDDFCSESIDLGARRDVAQSYLGFFGELAREAHDAGVAIDPYCCVRCDETLNGLCRCPVCQWNPEDCDPTVDWDIGGSG